MEQILIVIGVIIFSMTLHEVAHAYVAYWLGDHTAKASGRLTFNPIKHLDPFMSLLMPLILAIAGLPIFGGAKPVPVNFARLKWGDIGIACVAIAGPLVNFFLAFIAFSIAHYAQIPADSLLGEIISIAIMVNLGFFVFNMLPIPPLDGSRILYAFAPDAAQNFMRNMERFGIFIVMVLVMFLGPIFSVIMVSAMQAILALFTHLVV